MSSDLFNLRSLRAPRLDERVLQQAVARVSKLTTAWESVGANTSRDLLDDLRKRLRAGLLKGESFEECTSVKRREWLLLSLYLNDLSSEESRAWLPSLDENRVVSILGEDAGAIKPHLRRLATQLYFTHFGSERLPCLERLCSMLELAWRAASLDRLDPSAKVWAEHAHILFAVDAPDKVADHWERGSSVDQLADKFHIHKRGFFRERLFEALIMNRLRRAPLDIGDEELNNLVVTEKERTMTSGHCLGAAAVRILVNRTQKECNSKVPEAWCEQLVTFACDPRIPSKQEQYRWWGWATTSEKDVAIRALSKLSLQAFISLLEESLRGTPAGHQFPARRNMLLKLFERGKVIDARLVVHKDIYYGMDAKTKNLLKPSWVSGGPQHTSFICLRCTDDVYLIEGTHSFSLRGFVGASSFPISGYWESIPKHLYDFQFRIHESKCPIYQKHQGRHWAWEFVMQLRNRHIEWGIFT